MKLEPKNIWWRFFKMRKDNDSYQSDLFKIKRLFGTLGFCNRGYGLLQSRSAEWIWKV